MHRGRRKIFTPFGRACDVYADISEARRQKNLGMRRSRTTSARRRNSRSSAGSVNYAERCNRRVILLCGQARIVSAARFAIAESSQRTRTVIAHYAACHRGG